MADRTRRRCARDYLLVAAALFLAKHADAQVELGHKLPGSTGLNAGSTPAPGVYVVDLIASYESSRLLDRNGNELPARLKIDAIGNIFGVAATFDLRDIATTFTASAGLPLASVSANKPGRPEASIDNDGLGDVYVQPLKLGWRTGPVDIVTGYAFYAPTGGFEPGGNDGIGRGHWTHQLSLGGTVYFDRHKEWSLSALASWDINTRKRGVDIVRGATVLVQGGAGVRLWRHIGLGIAGYALWQITDDSGRDLPQALRGARDRALGLGPEMDVAIPDLGALLCVRYEHDFAVESRPEGQIFVVSLRVAAWMPPHPP
jgi:hypothetical protein